MKIDNNKCFSGSVSVFQDRYLPERGVLLAGYSALIKEYGLKVPLPRVLAAVSLKYTRYHEGHWEMFTPKHAPDATLSGHLTFALKYEGVNLLVLKVLFTKVTDKEIIQIVEKGPFSIYSRRIWFLYEWLLQTQLSLPDAVKGNFTDVLDVKLQYPGPVRVSKRHRVRNNLPGVHAFCPIIKRTKCLDDFIKSKLSEKINKTLHTVHPDILMRAAAFMLLKDSKASYAIEGEMAPQTRAERWARVIGQAGLHPLSHEEFLRLQNIVIADFRFTHFGYRSEGGFIGEHERGTGLPIPEHISARWKDVSLLMDGLIETEALLKESEFDAVLTAAMISFGFVFIHPFEDGNGRIHRYLMHHVLADKHFTPKGTIFPISAVILERIEEYRETLECYSRPRLRFIKWRSTEKGNVEITNETIDLYRYFDATKQAEFLYDCIQETVNKTLPEEINYLKNYDEIKSFIKGYIDMPDRLVDLLIRFLDQGEGKLPKRAKKKEFDLLTEKEIEVIEERFTDIFFSDF